MAIIYGFNITKEVHQSRSVDDYAVRPNLWNISADSVLGYLLGAVVGIISGLFVGLFFKILPWWLARGVHLGIGVGMFLLGLNVLLD